MYGTSEEGSRARKGNSELSGGERLLQAGGMDPDGKSSRAVSITHVSPPHLSRDPAPEMWIHKQKAVTSFIPPRKGTKAGIHCKRERGAI